MQPLRGLVAGLTILLIAATAAAIAAAGALFHRTRVVDRFLDGERVSFSDVDRADNLVQGTTLLFLLGFVVAGIVWIVWQYRLASNAERFTGRLGLRPGWAIGGWFIPLAAPVLAAIQLVQADRRAGDRPRLAPAKPLVIAWLVVLYAGWVLNAVGSGIRPDFEQEGGELRDFARADRLAAVGFALVAVAGVLAVLMVRKLSTRQHAAAGP